MQSDGAIAVINSRSHDLLCYLKPPEIFRPWTHALHSMIAKSNSPHGTLQLFALALVALTQFGCVMLETVDSTRAPIYAVMLGQRFELKQLFLAHGIKSDEDRGRDFSYVVIGPPPGIGGRFVVKLGPVAAGSRFTIVGVTTHRSKLFPSTEYVVRFDDEALIASAGKPIRISDGRYWNLYAEPASPGEAPQLNEHYFRPIPKD
jgi:hypothetical protein